MHPAIYYEMDHSKPYFHAVQSDNTAPYLHDAVLLWAKLAQEARGKGISPSDGVALLDRARNRAFTGSSEYFSCWWQHAVVVC